MFFCSFFADKTAAKFFRWPVPFALGLCLVSGSAGAAEPTPLRVNVCPGAQNLPLYVGLAQSIFEKHGLKIDLQFTPSSDAQRSGLASDAKFDLEGFKHVLALRAEFEGQWGGKPPAPERYFDLRYYERALKQAGR